MKKILMVVNEDRFFLSHRKDIALHAKQEGYDIKLVAKDTGQRRDVEALGIEMIELPINPTGMNLKEELKTFHYLYNLYRNEHPDVVHHVGLKNILWGGLAAKFAKVPGVLNAVSGLGVLFSGDSLSRTATMVLKVMRFSNKRMNVAELFQNEEDKQLFLSRKVIAPEQCYFTKGSGVDLNEYPFTPEPTDSVLRVMFTARMVKEKGMVTLIEAAELLRSQYENKVQFLLCGLLSNNPKGIKKHELEALCDGNYIQWLGHRSDIPHLLQNCHVVAFPSYYREGVPRSLIEACAVGRPIVTCNSIGCKDVVTEGENGFLIEPQDSKALAERLDTLFSNSDLRKQMGIKARRKAEQEFALSLVVDKHMEIYKQLFG